ncbi:MAG: 8-amino-7-oxononanoate synthase [bacterium]
MVLSLEKNLAKRRAAHRYRQRRVLMGKQQVQQCVDGQSLLSFSSNDYLGLASDPRVIAAMQHGAEAHGVGSGASHLVNGHNEAHHALEKDLADHMGRDRALLFSTGYMANLGVVSALCGRHDTVLADRLVHASLIDATRLSGADLKRVAHNDTSAMEAQLGSITSGALVVSEGVFSMDGDQPDFRVMADQCQDSNATLMIDDAHGLGVLGRSGAGSLEVVGLNQEDVPILMGTLGKALGCFGAFVAGSDSLIENLIQESRSYIYTTALPPAVAEAARVALKICREEQWRRDQLGELVTQFREGASALGLSLANSGTPIQPLIVGEDQLALDWSQALETQGILVAPIRTPTVPAGQARLRITLSAQHQPNQVNELLTALARVRDQYHEA